MNKVFRWLTIAVQVVILGAGAAAAQERKFDRRQFLDYLETSRKLTMDSPFRDSVTVQMGDSQNGNWEPYSSWVVESIFPDRSYLSYKTGRQGDFVRIGKYLYSKEQHSSPWVRTEEDKWVSIPSSPSASPAFKGPLVEYSVTQKDASGTVIRVVSKPTPSAESKDTLISFYWFDAAGILSRKVSVGFNGFRFVRRTSNYEYDPNITIEAPIK